MKNLKIILTALLFLWFGISGASGQAIDLFDWGFNIDGTTYCLIGPCDNNSFDPASIPGLDASGFDFDTGLGDITVTVGGSGAHFVDFFVDHEIDEVINTYFNENGTGSGALAPGQSAEIDEPGYVFGDIYDNFLDSTLDNTNDVPPGLEDDVSMAMGWDFSGAATVDFFLGLIAPTSGFYLTHTDPDSAASIYFSSTFTPVSIPEPSFMLLVGTGLVGLVGMGEGSSENNLRRVSNLKKTLK